MAIQLVKCMPKTHALNDYNRELNYLRMNYRYEKIKFFPLCEM